MAVKYLDSTGLGYVWSKFKAWCNATFAAITHSHASNAVNAMTGYSKPSSGSTITVNDSLNDAIGKLEAKVDFIDDNNCVHKTGDETITGSKTFSNTISGSINGNAATATKLGTATVGATDKPVYLDAGIATAVSSTLRTCYGGVESEAVENTYFKIGSGSIAGIYNHLKVSILVQHLTSKDSCIWDIWLAIDSVAGVYSQGCSILFNNTGYYGTNLIVAYKSNSGGSLDFELYVKETDRYSNHRFTVIQECWRNNQKVGNILTLYNQLTTTGTSSITSGYTTLTTIIGTVNMNINGSSTSCSGNAATASAIAWSGVTGKPTTIVGYGITDAKIVNETITLGSNSITPLTSHQDISGKVNKTGDTMTGDLRVSSLFFDYNLCKKHLDVVKGTNPSEIKFWSLYNCDKNGTNYANNMLGVVETTLLANGVVSTYMKAIKNEAGSTANGMLGVSYDTTNNYAYTFAPTPTATTDNTNKIATTEWVRNATGNTALNADGSFGLTMFADLGSNYQMDVSDFSSKPVCVWHVNSFADNTTSAPSSNVGDFTLTRLYTGLTNYACILCTSPRTTRIFYGHFWEGTWSGWNTLHTESVNLQFKGNANAVLLSKDNNTLFLCGGTDIQNNAFIELTGGTNPSSAVTPGAFYLHARTSSTANKVLAGTPGGTLTWMGQSLQTTSDQRLKTKLESIPDEVLNAWENVKWGQFQYLEAVNEKGKNARLHSGLVSQQVQNAFLECNLDACSYGLICHEIRDEIDEDIIIETLPAYTDNEGVFHPEKKVTDHYHEDAVDLWMIRYTEALCMEAAYQRRKNKILERRISELETQVENMLQVLESLKGA